MPFSSVMNACKFAMYAFDMQLIADNDSSMMTMIMDNDMYDFYECLCTLKATLSNKTFCRQFWCSSRFTRKEYVPCDAKNPVYVSISNKKKTGKISGNIIVLGKSQNLCVESISVTIRQKNCHKKWLGRVYLCRRIWAVPTVEQKNNLILLWAV